MIFRSLRHPVYFLMCKYHENTSMTKVDQNNASDGCQ